MIQKKRVEINVIDWKNGTRDVALFFPDFDQMLAIPAEGARYMAFRLMECADFIDPPFGEPSVPPQATIIASEEPEDSIFGPESEDDEPEEDNDDYDDDESDEDDEC